ALAVPAVHERTGRQAQHEGRAGERRADQTGLCGGARRLEHDQWVSERRDADTEIRHRLPGPERDVVPVAPQRARAAALTGREPALRRRELAECRVERGGGVHTLLEVAHEEALV